MKPFERAAREFFYFLAVCTACTQPAVDKHGNLHNAGLLTDPRLCPGLRHLLCPMCSVRGTCVLCNESGLSHKNHQQLNQNRHYDRISRVQTSSFCGKKKGRYLEMAEHAVDCDECKKYCKGCGSTYFPPMANAHYEFCGEMKRRLDSNNQEKTLVTINDQVQRFERFFDPGSATAGHVRYKDARGEFSLLAHAQFDARGNCVLGVDFEGEEKRTGELKLQIRGVKHANPNTPQRTLTLTFNLFNEKVFTRVEKEVMSHLAQGSEKEALTLALTWKSPEMRRGGFRERSYQRRGNNERAEDGPQLAKEREEAQRRREEEEREEKAQPSRDESFKAGNSSRASTSEKKLQSPNKSSSSSSSSSSGSSNDSDFEESARKSRSEKRKRRRKASSSSSSSSGSSSSDYGSSRGGDNSGGGEKSKPKKASDEAADDAESQNDEERETGNKTLIDLTNSDEFQFQVNDQTLYNTDEEEGEEKREAKKQDKEREKKRREKPKEEERKRDDKRKKNEPEDRAKSRSRSPNRPKSKHHKDLRYKIPKKK